MNEEQKEQIFKGTIDGYKQIIEELKLQSGILALSIPIPYVNGFYRCPLCFGLGDSNYTINHLKDCYIRKALSYIDNE